MNCGRFALVILFVLAVLCPSASASTLTRLDEIAELIAQKRTADARARLVVVAEEYRLAHDARG